MNASDKAAIERRASEAEATVRRMRELLEEVIDGSVDASTYPDGPCLDSDLRKRIKAELRSEAFGLAPCSPISFDQFCEDSKVNDDEREALVHHLAGIRYREALTLVDGPIARAAKAAAAKRRRTKSETLNDTNRAEGRPSYHGSRMHQRIQDQAAAEQRDLANPELTGAQRPV